MLKKQKKQFLLQVAGISFVFAAVAGAFSGIIATVITNDSLDAYYQTLSQEQELLAISQVKPQNIPGTYEDALSVVKDKTKNSIAILYASSVDSSSSSAWISKGNFLGSGAIVTNDGWIAFHSDALGAYGASQLDVWIGEERYEIQDIVLDLLSDCAMVKIDASNLRSVAFGDSQAVESGRYLFSTQNSESIFAVHVDSTMHLPESLAQPAEVFTHGWQLRSSVWPSALFNASGEFVGVASNLQAVPLEHSYAFLQSVLRQGIVQHASIGCTVVEMQDVLNVSADVGVVGAYITKVGNGPAKQAGLQTGDIILGINGRLVDSRQTLAEVLTQFSAGDLVTIQIMRLEEKLEIELILENYSN
ncbi:PDZ domain-containing protein [Patescibacteria group bacterium]|nr:PDZ domain-containing protein [Patescibacteria group bacterium]